MPVLRSFHGRPMPRFGFATIAYCYELSKHEHTALQMTMMTSLHRIENIAVSAPHGLQWGQLDDCWWTDRQR